MSAASVACQAVQLTDWRQLLAVIWDFLSLSLFSLGGGNTLLNEYHHMAVDQYCWLSSRQFADIYAIAEAAPGPSSMIVGLLGMGADDDGEELVVFRPEQDHHAAVLGVHAQGFNLGVQHALSIDWAREDLPR